MKFKQAQRWALVLTAAMAAGAAGCSSSSTSKSGDDGKSYAPSGKDKQAAAGKSSTPVTSAETTTGKPSAASDDGSTKASQGQVVLNPGSPQAAQPAGNQQSPQH